MSAVLASAENRRVKVAALGPGREQSSGCSLWLALSTVGRTWKTPPAARPPLVKSAEDSGKCGHLGHIALGKVWWRRDGEKRLATPRPEFCPMESIHC